MLPSVPLSSLDVRPIDWHDLPTRFMPPGELETLIGLIRTVEQPRHVIEFGVNVGRTALVVLRDIAGVERYTGIDVPLDYKPILALQNDNAVPNPGEMVLSDPRFHLIIKPRGSLDLTVADLETCDVAFIDGDHGRAAVEHDSRLARMLVRPGGIIIWHDFHSLGNVDVASVLNEQYAAGRPLIHIEDTWFVFERIPIT